MAEARVRPHGKANGQSQGSHVVSTVHAHRPVIRTIGHQVPQSSMFTGCGICCMRLCELGSQSPPFTLLELRGFLFFFGPGSSGDGGGVLPSGFEGLAGEHEGKMGIIVLAGNTVHSTLFKP
nr:hypothetical protein [Tanacetum cinerariifolium]